jgi:hypothetical protein
MTPTLLQRDDLRLDYIRSLAMSPDGRRAYAGRFISDDQTRENLAVLDIDPLTGAVLARRLFRDSDRPLPASYTTPKAARPRSTVKAIVVGTRYGKLYVAAEVEDGGARPTRWLTIYDLDEHGDPIAATLRSYRADVDNFTGAVGIDCMALNPAAHALYMSGGGWSSLRYYLLDEAGEPIGTQPIELKLPGGGGRRGMAVNAAGTRLYLGTHPRTLNVLRVQDGVPQLEPPVGGQPAKPLRTLSSAVPEVGLGGDNYLRFVATPRALFAVRSYESLIAVENVRARPVPLYALALDEHGDVSPGVVDWTKIDGFEHIVLAHDSANARIWLARETTAEPPAPAPVPDGFELVAYALGEDGLPGAEVERHPKVYAQQPLVAAAVVASGAAALLSRPIRSAIDYAAGERLRLRIRRAAADPSRPTRTFSCRLSVYGTAIVADFRLAEEALSEPVVLDEFLTGRPAPVVLRLFFPPAAVDDEYTIEAHYTPAGAADAIVATETVRGRDVLFLLPGYAMVPPQRRPASFEPFSARMARYRAAAEEVAVRPDERPDQFVVSGYSVIGGQGHAAQLDDELAALRALGINSVQFVGWEGIPAGELAERAAGFSPESGVYGPPLGTPFAFAYDGSLRDRSGIAGQDGKLVDHQYLREWAETQARRAAQTNGMPAARVVRFQLADEPGWYFPSVLGLLDRDAPTTPIHQKVDWSDPERRNATWIARFREYVETNDPELPPAFGSGWDEVVPIGAGAATTPPLRRLFFWSTRFFVEQAVDGVQLLDDELQTAFKAQRAPDPRPEHNRLHVHLNFGETLDWQWYKPYPNAAGDKNPDQGPDAATGGYDWFRLGRHASALPSKHTYLRDSSAQVWSFYADLLRSATAPLGADGSPDFTAFVPGSSLGDLPGGAAYKLLSVVARGAKLVTAYAFGPLFAPPNSWADNLAAYGPLADAMRLIGRGERLLYPGRPERAKVAVQLPASSRLWDRSPIGAPFYQRDVLALHTALVHDGYTVDLVDDAALAAGVLDERGYTTLYLLGPNLPVGAQRRIAAWVRGGGTLVALPGAATADEFDEPATGLDEVLGVAARAAWEPLREAAHRAPTFGLSHRLTVSDAAWRDAIGGAEPLLLRDLVGRPTAPQLFDFPTLELDGAQAVATLAPAARPDDARPAVTRHAVGEGVAFSYAFYPGWQYWCTATHPLFVPRTKTVHTDRLPRNWSTPDRLLATLPVRLANTPRAVELSHSAVEARRLDSDAGTAVVLLNWTGEPIDALTVGLPDGSARRVTSLRQGALDGGAVRAASVSVTLALYDVDVLLFEP